jgi:release factor glutamine methyltransferase
MTVRDAINHTREELKNIYAVSEAARITDWLIEYITKVPREERISIKQEQLKPEQTKHLQQLLERLKQHEPIQYVLNECWFYGLKFYVDNSVLIPRPETEELVEWMISNLKFPINNLNILDIGTGSGCIAISLKRKLRKAEVWACDVSEKALQVARKNAATLGADVRFLKLDFLDKKQLEQLPSFDIIVSNPPYVPEKDKDKMQPNVLKYEPATALFVSDKDALIFYKNIAEFGKTHLNKYGTVYTEIHEDTGKAVTGLFQINGYTTELKQDMQGKDRMVKAML